MQEKAPVNNGYKKSKKLVKDGSPAKSKAQSEFKKRYFEFYDDIKISDRQDW